tara:strand:- start:993 stop:1598 length:606 start_codon:yes stop_codon:yes gene_type:complete
MTGIAVDLIGIIAGFEALCPLFEVESDNAIAASSRDAGIATAIVLAVIAVIAEFCPFDSSISTGFDSTHGIAAVSIDPIGVVALFRRFFIGPDNPITARGNLAIIGAGISVPTVPIIAGFIALPYITVAAASGLATTGAVVGLIVVAIVTALTTGLADSTIATAHGFTLVGAAITGVFVAIVAFFVALLNAITAASGRAVV